MVLVVVLLIVITFQAVGHARMLAELRHANERSRQILAAWRDGDRKLVDAFIVSLKEREHLVADTFLEASRDLVRRAAIDSAAPKKKDEPS